MLALALLVVARLVAAARARTAATDATLCTQLADTNCLGDDIRDAGVVANATLCCALCGQQQDCRAWTFNRELDQHCWLKRDCAGQKHDPSAISGRATTAGGKCELLPGTNCQKHDLRNAGPVSDSAACCSLCDAEPDCRAWTWNRDEGNHGCWLKHSCEGKVQDPKAESGVVQRGPAPPLPPSPPAPTGRQVGVSLGGWMLMETSWMYDQFKAPTENDWVRQLRQRGDDYALRTMQTHWSSYIPDEALDLMLELGINHVRMPVGYWLVEPPVVGGTMRDAGFQHEGFATGGVVFVERMLQKLKTRGISALIDLHAMPGGSSKCQSYAGMAVTHPNFWTSSTPGNATAIPACPGAGPYHSSRPAGQTWMSVGESAAKSLAAWIVDLEKNNSLSGVVTGFEVINEPGLGFNGMEEPIRRYHDAIVPAVQKMFRNAKLAINTTVNFIGPNDGGMGSWLKSRIDAHQFDGSALTVDFHDYYNWDGPLSFTQVRNKVCKTTNLSCGWSQYVQMGLTVVIGEWADAIDNNKPPSDNIDDPTVRKNLASLFADQVSLFDSAASTTGHYYWAMRMGSGWDPRPEAASTGHQVKGTAWDRSLKSYGDRTWNLGELARVGVVKSVGGLNTTAVCRCIGCSNS